MHPLLLLAASLAATAGERPKSADKKATRIHREARQVWIRCVVARDGGDEVGCLLALAGHQHIVELQDVHRSEDGRIDLVMA